MTLTNRENEILGLIVEHYIDFDKPASSTVIASRGHLLLSSATIRNVMGKLENIGFLYQPHISAGRVPTESGIRYYVDNILRVEPISDENRFKMRNIYLNMVERDGGRFRGAINFISSQAKQASVGFLPSKSDFENDNEIFINGVVHLIDHFHFSEVSKLKPFLHVLEDKETLLPVLKNATRRSKTHVFFSSELKELDLPPCSLITSPIRLADGRNGALLVLGNLTMRYCDVISLLEYTSSLVNDI
ncbi:MAG: hypothetical protein A3F16_06690 [Deltaproteobacteria bacterium RIFCSPHIGHO2_12_FULL_43_9]|nr:MAG: hypothetical protein A3F16_06690 [Deltaproteobacteria bacterium RIFCSPHIGHO2_12_FULL_43_9]